MRVVRRRRGLGQRDGEAPELGALAVAPDARGPHLAERPRGPAALRRDQDELEDGRLVPALARRDDGDDVLRRGPRRGLRVGEGPRQREPRAGDEGLGRRHVADAADDARAEHERAVLGPQLEAVLAWPRHAAGHPVRSPRRGHGARREQRGRHELVALAGLEGLEVLEGDRAHGALRGRRGLEAGQGEGRHAEARAEPRPSSEPAPKTLPFASTTRAPPETGPGAPKRLRAGSRAALVPDWRLDEGRCWTRPRPADSQPRARSAAKLMRRRLSRVEAPFILSWAIFLGCAGREPDECARDPGRRTAAPRRGGVVLASGRALIFCKARGFSSVRWRDLGAATYNLPKNPHPRRLHGRNGVVRASLLPGRRRAAKSVQVVLQRRSRAAARLARLDLGRAARCAGEDRLLSSAPHGLKRPKSEAYIPEE